MLLRKEIEAIPNNSIFSLPLGIEYDRLQDWLIQRREKKYHIKDFRLKKDESKILSPGTSNSISNQSAINFEEPNTKPVYPIETIPYSQGVIWE